MDPQKRFCHNQRCWAYGRAGEGHIVVHGQKERRYRCKGCMKTFSETKGTALYRPHEPHELLATIVTLPQFLNLGPEAFKGGASRTGEVALNDYELALHSGAYHVLDLADGGAVEGALQPRLITSRPLTSPSSLGSSRPSRQAARCTSAAFLAPAGMRESLQPPRTE
jgi:hypothetical protein